MFSDAGCKVSRLPQSGVFRYGTGSSNRLISNASFLLEWNGSEGGFGRRVGRKYWGG